MDTVSSRIGREALSFAEFYSEALTQFVPLKVSSDKPGAFRGTMTATHYDEVSVVDIRARSHEVERTPELIARGARDCYKLTLQVSGTGLLIQDRREAFLRPGDIAIYDTDRPYSLLYEEGGHFLVFMFPRRLLQLPADAVGQLTAVRFPGDQGIGSIVGPLLSTTAQPMHPSSPGTAARLTYGALDFVTTMLSDELDLRGAPRDPRAALARRLRGYIDENLADADLTPARIAAANFISTRHLHGVFHDQGTTVSTWIKEQRLERCRRDLIDPVHADKPIAVIAARWGIHDAARFSRAFKATFGISPSDHRASMRSR